MISMSKNKTKSKTPPTPEKVKALIDAQDWAWQQRLWRLFLLDPNSQIGGNVRSLLGARQVVIDRLEQAAGLGLGDIDPEELLNREETLKQAKKRLRKKTVGAVKQAKHRAKKRMAKLKHTMPGVVMQGGHVVRVTEQP
jgi:hypothetical protein